MKRSVPIFLLILFLAPSAARPAAPEDVPEGSTAGVIQSKIQDEAEEEIEEKEIPASFSVDLGAFPEEGETAVPFYVKEIKIRPFGKLTQEELDSLVDSKALQAVLDDYEGREVRFKELLEMKEKLELVYRREGYFAVARISPEEITEEVIVEILMSRMGSITVDGARHYRLRKTLSYWRLDPGEILRYDEIEKSVYAMNENPGRLVKPLLKAGKEPGTTDVILKSQEEFPLHGSFTWDNEGVNLTGDDRLNFSLRHNNLLTLDDIFLIGMSFGQQFGAIFLQHKIPLGSRGTSFRYGFSHAQVSPKKEFKQFGISGTSETYSLTLDQALIRNDRLRWDTALGIDFKEKRTKVLSTTSVWDRERVLHTDTSFQRRDTQGVWSGNQSFHFGFSPHTDGFRLNSRQGETRFFKYEFLLQRRHKLPFKTDLTLRTSGQLSGDSLLPQEQLFLGGATTVRGYPDSDYGADQGIFWNVEFRVPIYFIPEEFKLPRDSMGLRERIKAVYFLDQGYGRLKAPSDREHKSRTLLGTGAGFEVQLWDHYLARGFWGAPLAQDPLTESSESQFHFLLTAEV